MNWRSAASHHEMIAMKVPSTDNLQTEQERPATDRVEDGVSTLPNSLGTPRTLPPRDKSLPERIGRYRVMRLLGRGGMGTVYLAEDTQLERQVALKVPHFAADESASALERFYREARTAARLHHPNICPVYDVDTIDNVHYLTMAYIEGQTLAQLVPHFAARPARESAALVAKLARALDEAHRQGIIHRDLKPSNIMMDRRGEPVVMDFGLARRIDGGDTTRTGPGVVLGTPSYMAPEQARGDVEAVGPASDIYSLGVVLYQLLAGALPFKGTTMEVLAQHMRDVPPPPAHFRAGIDPAIEAVCLKAMAKEPCQRYLSMAEFAQALDDCVSGKAADAETTLVDDPLDQSVGSILLLLRTWGWFIGCDKVAALLPADSPPESRPALLIRWLSGDPAALDEARDRFRALRQFPALNGWALLVRAGRLNKAHDFGPAGEMLRRARAEADPRDNILQSEIARQDGFRHYHLGRLEEALRDLHLALDLCGRDHYLTGWVLEMLGKVYATKDNFHAAEEFFELAIACKARRNDLVGVARTRIQLGWLYQAYGHLDQAEEQLQKALLETQQGGDAVGQPTVLHYLGTVARKRGERLEAGGKRSAANRHWKEAAELLEASIRGHKALQRPVPQAYACNERARVALAQGEEGAEAFVKEADALFQETRFEEGLAFTRRTWGVLYRQRGQHGESLKQLQEALLYFDRTSDRAVAAQVRFEMARTLIASGEVRQLCTHALLDALKRAERCRRPELVERVEEELRALDEEAHWKHIFHRVRGRGASVDTTSLAEGENETASVLFLNLQSFVPFCQGRDAGDVMRTLNQLMADLGEALERHRGFVTAYLGGGFMALFREQGHADRAVQAALDLLAVVEEFNRPRAVLGLRQLPVRIAVASGTMFLGNIGTYYKMDFTAVGAAVNLASRLMRQADPQKPCISPETYRLVSERFTFAPEGPRVLDLADIGRCEVWDVVGRKERG